MGFIAWGARVVSAWLLLRLASVVMRDAEQLLKSTAPMSDTIRDHKEAADASGS